MIIYRSNQSITASDRVRTDCKSWVWAPTKSGAKLFLLNFVNLSRFHFTLKGWISVEVRRHLNPFIKRPTLHHTLLGSLERMWPVSNAQLIYFMKLLCFVSALQHARMTFLPSVHVVWLFWHHPFHFHILRPSTNWLCDWLLAVWTWSVCKSFAKMKQANCLLSSCDVLRKANATRTPQRSSTNVLQGSDTVGQNHLQHQNQWPPLNYTVWHIFAMTLLPGLGANNLSY